MAKASDDDIFNLFQQLSTMIMAGMPLMDSLQLSGQQSQSIKLGRVMEAITSKGIRKPESKEQCDKSSLQPPI